MHTAAPLSTIIALARAGALDHAWHEFHAAGFDERGDDPAALTVKGRLLKDRALRASGEERRHFYMQSADAYQRSASLQPGTYPLINAATLALLSGDRGRAEEIAREVLGRIEREPDEPETPYWRAATEAEALLLLGKADEARTALDAAVAAAPMAWEDHASTLRQFLAIHDELGGDRAWLDRLRPSRSLHYSGPAPPPADSDCAALAREVEAFLDREKVGFAFGALAAGAEIIVAEALLEREAQLNIVLPSDPESYASAFVDPYGGAWRRRFDAALEAAESVQLVRPLDAPPEPRAIALADEIAMGGALLNAEWLMGESVRLVVGDGPAAGANRADEAAIRTHVIASPPGAEAGEAAVQAPLDARAILVSLLALGVGEGGEDDFQDRLEQVRLALAAAGPAMIAPHLGGDSILIGYDGPRSAAEAARLVHRRLRGEMPIRIAAHHGLVSCVRDPFLGSLRPTEQGAAIVRTIVGAIPPDTICVSGDFAAILAASGGAPCEASRIGELQAFDGGSPIRLYALRPSSEGS